MSSSAFYYKLNKKINLAEPIGSIQSMIEGVDSPVYYPSGDIINTFEFPLLNAFIVGQNDYYRGITTTDYSLSTTGQIVTSQIAASSSEIITIGENSKIYRSVNGETWTSYDCPAPAGVFTGGLFLDYAPGYGFYINERIGSRDWIYSTPDGITWTVYDLGVPPTGYTNYYWYNFVSGFSYTKYLGGVGFGAGVFGRVCMSTYYDGTEQNYVITLCRGAINTSYHSCTYIVLDGAPSYYYGYVPWSSFPVCSDHYTIGTRPTSVINDNPYFNQMGGYLHCVNGLYQNKIFMVNGYTLTADSMLLLSYTSSFKFPSSNMLLLYDVSNARYFAVNRDNNYFYTSTNGITWSGATALDSGVFTVNGVAVRHNQSRIIAIGNKFKYSDNFGTAWTTQAVNIVGGNFTSVATDNITGNTVSSALASSTIAKATNGMNFDIVSITTSADWQNVYYDGTKFIITSRARDLKTSGDSITWTAQATHTAFTNSAHYITSMAHSGAHYCAISPSSVDTLTSVDGITWAKRASTVPIALNSISIGTLVSGTVRTVAVGTNICYTSDDYGVTAFTTRTIGTGNWSNLSYNNSRFVCISLNSLLLAHSTDGITWTTVVTPFQPKSLVYTDNMWIIKGSTTLTSTNDLITFRLSQPCEDTTSGAITVYDSISEKVITANATSISYADISIEKIRLPYVESSDSGIINYIKVA